jgi:hypothetical protein
MTPARPGTDQMKMNRQSLTPERREQITRAILTSDIGSTHNQIAKQVGVSRECVRQVRTGQLYKAICPELPRLAPGSFTLNCADCTHFVRERLRRRGGSDRIGYCGLGIPECLEALEFARGCGAFAHALESEA